MSQAVKARVEMVSTAKLKDLARKILKDGSPLKTLILDEPDRIPRSELATKVELFDRLLLQETKYQNQ